MRQRFLLALPLMCLTLAASPAEPLADLAWLSGTWSGERDGLLMEESWSAPRGGVMLGTHRDLRGGRVVSFEFFRLAAEEGRVVYHASPQGRPAVPFTLAEQGEKRVVFANPEHDFPQRILYWLDGESRLHARVEGPQSEKEQAMEWVWTRVDPCAH